MGKVVFFRSPFDSSKISDKEFSGTIEEALVYWRIEKESLCVTINGKTPDDCDLKYIIQENDLIEIRRLVHGRSSRSKGALGTVLQVIGLIAVTIASFGGVTAPYLLAMGIAAGIAGGALQARAARMALKEMQNSNQGDIDTQTNNFSLNSATNENRPLKPMPIPMGSIFYAPDYNAIPYRNYTGGLNASTVQRLIPHCFNPGGDYENGVLAPFSGWNTMPVNYIATGLPQVELMFPPDINIATLKTDVLANTTNFRDIYCAVSGYNKPIICYHSDPSDTLYGKYNSFALHVSVYVDGGSNLTYFSMLPLFNEFSTLTANLVHFIGYPINPPLNNNFQYPYLDFVTAETYAFYFPGVVEGNSIASQWYNQIPKLRTWLIEEVNGGVLNDTSYRIFSPAILTASLYNVIPSVIREAYEYATHIFNFGLGDMTISNRRLEKVPILSATGTGYNEIDKDSWELFEVYATSFLRCYNRIKQVSNKNLFNLDSPETPVPLSDQNTYNFSYFDGPLGYGTCNFNIVGRLYAATGSGMATNKTLIEIQYKRSSQIDWQESSLVYYENNNTKYYVKSESISPISTSNFPTDESLQVRIRKVTRDSVNNSGENVCELDITNIFFLDFGLYANNPMPLDFRPRQLEAMAIVANAEMSAQTNRYAAQVDSKCWVYDFNTETWSWEYNRNPAFWFLYFAYGGFLNVPADGTYTYPYSPTKGWVNYPGHPDNTEQLFGVGLNNDEIDLDKILAWAEFCEDRNLKMDLVLKDDSSCADALERIANVGRASVTYYTGKLSIVYEDEEQIPTCMFGMGNIIAGSFGVDYMVSDPVGKVVANFVDRDKEWQTEQVEAIVPYSDSDNLRILEVTLEGVTERIQAQREVNILAARQFYQRRSYKWKVDIEGLIARRGDLVYLSHDSTQYGYSGRIKNFIYESGVITGIETTVYLEDSSTNHVTIRYPDGNMQVYDCHISGNNIIFDQSYPINKGAFYVSPTQDNSSSDYANSIPEDFIFIAGSKETPGKIVRISEIRPDDEMNFEIVAVDEDPAMWSYEYNDLYDPDPSPESFDNSELVLKVTDIKTEKLGNGLVRVYWEGSEFIQIINEFTGNPIESNGAYSFSGGVVVLELIPNEKYTLRIEPFAIGTPYKSESKKVVVWA